MLLLDEGRHVRRRHALQELHILVRVKLRHLTFCGRLCALLRERVQIALVSIRTGRTYEDFHLLVQTVVHDEGMTHPYTCRFHPAT